MISPYMMAFNQDELTLSFLIIEILLDLVFLIDIFVNFSMTFYDKEFELVQNRKVRVLK